MSDDYTHGDNVANHDYVIGELMSKRVSNKGRKCRKKRYARSKRKLGKYGGKKNAL